MNYHPQSGTVISLHSHAIIIVYIIQDFHVKFGALQKKLPQWLYWNPLWKRFHCWKQKVLSWVFECFVKAMSYIVGSDFRGHHLQSKVTLLCCWFTSKGSSFKLCAIQWILHSTAVIHAPMRANRYIVIIIIKKFIIIVYNWLMLNLTGESWLEGCTHSLKRAFVSIWDMQVLLKPQKRWFID